MSRNDYFMRLAYKQTFESKHKFPMAAILVRGNRIISVGNNQDKTHPKQAPRLGKNLRLIDSQRIHAELDCLIKSNYGLIEGSTMYIARHKMNLDFGLAKPCDACVNLLKQYRIKNVFYTTDHQFLTPGPWFIRERIESCE